MSQHTGITSSLCPTTPATAVRSRSRLSPEQEVSLETFDPTVLAALADDAEKIAQMGSWVWDLTTQEVHWSLNTYRLLGHEPGAIEPSMEAFFAAIHPDDQARVHAESAKVRETEVAHPVTYRIILPSGHERTLHSRGIEARDADGVLLRMVGTVQDITETMRKKRELTAQTQLLEAAADLAHVGTWQWYPSEDRHIWSAEMRRIAGVGDDFEPQKSSILELIHPDDAGLFMSGTQQLENSGSADPVAIRIVRSTGEVRHLVSIVRPSADVQPWFLGVVHDVTELRALEDRVRQAHTMEAVGRLASGVAHDFNNLLTVVLGNVSLLRSEVDHPSLDAIHDAAHSGSELTHRLLSVGRPAETRLAPVHLTVQIQSALEMFERVLGPDVRLRAELNELPTVLADPRQISQALLNLVLNSEHALPDGGDITIRAATGHDGWAEVRVIDNGLGMDKKTLARAIEPFFTTRDLSEGSGLGLSMVYGVVQTMGGTLSIDSVLGEGTTVCIRLPPTSEPIKQDPSAQDEVVGLTGVRILVVEDEPGVLQLATRILRRAGATVFPADGPAAAIAHGPDVDLVLSDVSMPGGGGRAVLEGLTGGRAHPPFLFMTGYARREPWIEPHRVLGKPFGRAHKLGAIREVLGL